MWTWCTVYTTLRQVFRIYVVDIVEVQILNPVQVLKSVRWNGFRKISNFLRYPVWFFTFPTPRFIKMCWVVSGWNFDRRTHTHTHTHTHTNAFCLKVPQSGIRYVTSSYNRLGPAVLNPLRNLPNCGALAAAMNAHNCSYYVICLSSKHRTQQAKLCCHPEVIYSSNTKLPVKTAHEWILQ
jgi:hypothetical protein